MDHCKLPSQRSKKEEEEDRRKFKGLMGHHQEEEYMHCGSATRSEEKVPKSLFKKIIIEIFSDLGKEMDIQIQEPHRTQIRCIKRNQHQEML